MAERLGNVSHMWSRFSSKMANQPPPPPPNTGALNLLMEVRYLYQRCCIWIIVRLVLPIKHLITMARIASTKRCWNLTRCLMQRLQFRMCRMHNSNAMVQKRVQVVERKKENVKSSNTKSSSNIPRVFNDKDGWKIQQSGKRKSTSNIQKYQLRTQIPC